MKKRAAAILVLLTFLTGNVYASVLGTVITAWSHDIAGGTQFYRNTFLSEQSGVGKQAEYYAEYTPNEDVRPAVITGGKIWGTRTITQAEKYMKDNGMVPLMGINASFFSFQTGVPMGHVISEGKIVSKDTQSYQSIGFLKDGSAFIAPLAIETTMYFGDTAIDIAHINKYNQTVTDVINLYTNDFDDNNHTDSASLDLILGNIEGELSLGETLTAEVEEKFNYSGSIKIPDGKIVLTLNESGNPELYSLLDSLSPGDKVSISSKALYDERWNVTESGLGSVGDVLIKNGEVQSGFEKGAAPRTAVGITENGNVIFYVIDGRQQGYSYGVQIKTLANRLKEFGCVDAINLDGGGSTAISGIYPGSDESAVLNSPSGGTLRGCTNYLFLQNMRKPTGEAGHIYLYPFEQHYLSGYSEQIYPTMTDTAYYKMDPPQNITFETEGTQSTIDASGILTARGMGEFTVRAISGGIVGSDKYHTYDTPTNINVYNGATDAEIKSLSLKKGDTVKLNLTAQYYYIDLKTSADCFNFEVTNDIGYINDNNELVVTSNGGSGEILVSAGEYTKRIPVTVADTSVFNDVAGHWARENILAIYSSGIISGYETERGLMFRSDNNMTREEFAVIMGRFLGIDIGEYANYPLNFNDADKISAWSAAYVAAMADKGIITGKGDGGKINFAPADTLTRAEAMTILGRVIGGEPELSYSFADNSDIPEWAKKYTDIMVSNGFVSGYDDNTIRPNGYVTRAEAVTMIYKIMNKSF